MGSKAALSKQLAPACAEVASDSKAFFCNSGDHFARDCPEGKGKGKDGKGKGKAWAGLS